MCLLFLHCLENYWIGQCIYGYLYLPDTRLPAGEGEIKLRIKQSNCDLNGEKVRAINSTECHGSAAMRIYQIQSQIGAHLQMATDSRIPESRIPSSPVSTSHPVTVFPFFLFLWPVSLRYA